MPSPSIASAAPQPARRDRARADPLLGRDLARDVVAGAVGDRQHERADQQVILHEELAAHAHQRGARQVLEPEVGIEGTA